MGGSARRAQHPTGHHRLALDEQLADDARGDRRTDAAPGADMAAALGAVRVLQPRPGTDAPPRDVPRPHVPEHDPDGVPLGPALPRDGGGALAQGIGYDVHARAPCAEGDRTRDPDGGVPVQRPRDELLEGALLGV